MYDYVIYAIGVFFDIFQHCLKLWTISGFGRCASVDKFLADDSPH
nr:hypothetical protein [uncultured Ruminococcus sp.]